MFRNAPLRALHGDKLIVLHLHRQWMALWCESSSHEPTQCRRQLDELPSCECTARICFVNMRSTDTNYLRRCPAAKRKLHQVMSSCRGNTQSTAQHLYHCHRWSWFTEHHRTRHDNTGQVPWSLVSATRDLQSLTAVKPLRADGRCSYL